MNPAIPGVVVIQAMGPPKQFRDQFNECLSADMVGPREGPEVTIDPAFPSPAFVEKVREEGALPKGRLNSCRRFGGACSSANQECRTLRGVSI